MESERTKKEAGITAKSTPTSKLQHLHIARQQLQDKLLLTHRQASFLYRFFKGTAKPEEYETTRMPKEAWTMSFLNFATMVSFEQFVQMNNIKLIEEPDDLPQMISLVSQFPGSPSGAMA